MLDAGPFDITKGQRDIKSLARKQDQFLSGIGAIQIKLRICFRVTRSLSSADCALKVLTLRQLIENIICRAVEDA